MSHFNTCWQHIRRTPYQALAAVAVMTLNLFIASIFITTAFSFEQILRFFETRPQVIAYFKDGVEIEEVEALKQKLLSTLKVSGVEYVSKEEALAIYREQNKDEPLLLEMVTASMLPASLEVSATKLDYLPEIAEILEKDELVSEVSFQEDIVSSLSVWTRTIRRFGVIVIGFTSLVSFLIILIIMGMKVAIRREEIEIMRLFGASFWYVRIPFLLEGVFYGILSAFLAFLLTYALILYATPFLVTFLEGIPLGLLSEGSFLPSLFMLVLLLGLVTGGLLIGAFGSLIAVRRYLR